MKLERALNHTCHLMLNLERRADAVRTVVHVHDQVALFIKSPSGVVVPGGDPVRRENEALAGCVVDHGGVKAECRQRLVVGSVKQTQT